MKLSITLWRTSDDIVIDNVGLVPNHWWERLLAFLHLLRLDQQIINYANLIEPTDEWYSLKIPTPPPLTLQRPGTRIP